MELKLRLVESMLGECGVAEAGPQQEMQLWLVGGSRTRDLLRSWIQRRPQGKVMRVEGCLMGKTREKTRNL